MHPEKKRLWIEALRSGDYRQAVGTLCTPNERNPFDADSHCCIGVAAVVFRIGSTSPMEDGMTHTLRVAHRLGLDNRSARRYARLNDEGYTFEQIAQIIEADDKL